MNTTILPTTWLMPTVYVGAFVATITFSQNVNSSHFPVQLLAKSLVTVSLLHILVCYAAIYAATLLSWR